MDCAAEFEKNVAALPGVTRASLNTAIGKLIVEGPVDLNTIRRVGMKGNYKITPESELQLKVKSGGNRELIRVAIAVAALLVGYVTELSTRSAAIYIPFYVVSIAVGGWGNFRKAFFSLASLDFNMSVLMSAAVIGAMAIGQWEEGAVVAFLYSVSEMLEAGTMERAGQSIRQLMDIAPNVACILRLTGEEDVPVEDIKVGDIMIIRPGEKIAMDGRVVKGISAINQAAITGESIPVEKGPGSEVCAGSLNTFGALEVEVTKLVQDNTIARIIHLVEEAQAKRAPSQVFVERFASVYTPIVLVLAVGIVLVPTLFLGYNWESWIYRGLTLLVVSCPCALVVSTPVAIVSAIGNAAKNGVLIKGGVYLEEAGSLAVIAFDKTGTLTKGEPVVTDVIPLGSWSEQEILQIAAALEERSEHPLAPAVLKSAKDQNIIWNPAENFNVRTGLGVQGTVNKQEVYIGSPRFFKMSGLSAPGKATEQVRRMQEEGKTIMLVGTKRDILGIIAVADDLRETSIASLAALKQSGLRHTIMLTGDNQTTARAIAARLGVDEFRAECLPQDKAAAIQELQRQYGKVGMVGDGINDAPALATADVGIAMGGAGTDTALETADIVLMADDLTKLPFAVYLSRAAMRIIRQNITFALVIKAIAVLAVFPGWLTLWLAILADMGASVLVTLNGIRLLGIKAEPEQK